MIVAGSMRKISLGTVVDEHAGELVKGDDGGTIVALPSSELVRWQVTGDQGRSVSIHQENGE